jgi:hypothetical protein
MRLGPRAVVCCHGWAGTICWADWANHHLLHTHFNQHLSQRHEQARQDEYIITVYWSAS